MKSKLGQLEEVVRARLDTHDAQIEELFDTVESLIEGNASNPKKDKQIGFVP